MLTIYYKEEKKSVFPSTKESEGPSELERVEAKGRVTISEGDRIVTGEEGIYDQDAQKITMTGNAVHARGGQYCPRRQGCRVPG